MTFLRTLRKLLLGETWLLPVGLAIAVAASAVLSSLASDTWADVGGFVLLAGVAIVLVLSVHVSARPRR
jgi:membrane protein implicated in regulation of membrane protease activity